jgi:hypothetical protein
MRLARVVKDIPPLGRGLVRFIMADPPDFPDDPYRNWDDSVLNPTAYGIPAGLTCFIDDSGGTALVTQAFEGVKRPDASPEPAPPAEPDEPPAPPAPQEAPPAPSAPPVTPSAPVAPPAPPAEPAK